MALKSKKISVKKQQRDEEIQQKISFTGVKPSPEDPRDYTTESVLAMSALYPRAYQAPKTPILNQLNISSCVAHACVSAMMNGEKNSVKDYNDYSRGYIYGNRAEDDFQNEGMVIRQALKRLNKCGDVYYNDFPYNQKYAEVAQKIASQEEELRDSAALHKIKNYYRCYTTEEIKAAIMASGGVIISVPTYSDFSRNLQLTKTHRATGHHAMLIVGWNKNNQWIVQNSWGKGWGYGGYLLMDMNYPVNEYWGITVGSFIKEPKKRHFSLKNNLTKAANKIAEAFSDAFRYIGKAFKR